MDILERLRGYNPPDRAIDEQKQIAVDINGAIAEIERLRNLVGTSVVEIDGVPYAVLPQVAGLLHAVSEERDELLANSATSVAGVLFRAELQPGCRVMKLICQRTGEVTYLDHDEAVEVCNLLNDYAPHIKEEGNSGKDADGK